MFAGIGQTDKRARRENAVKLGVPATIASTTLNISEAISKGLKALLDKLRSEWKKACPITR